MIRLIARLTGKSAEIVTKEWHAYWIGFSEMVCFRIPPLVEITCHSLDEISGEWHYYMWGRGTGTLVIICICLAFLA